MENVLNNRTISFNSLGKPKSSAGNIVEAFKTVTDVKLRNKVMILNLGSEAAAGAT